MKKLFLSVAVLAAVASCTKNEPVSVPQNNQIGFATLNNRVTKVANTNDDASHSNYMALANVKGENIWLFNEEMTSADAYVSGHIHYWPQSPATVDFYAYAPKAGAELVAGTATTSTIPLTFTVPAAAGIDFTVAAPVKGAKVGVDPVSAEGKVAMKFAHMLTKASFEVALEANLANSHTFSFTKAEFVAAKDVVEADAINGSAIKAVAGEEATYEYTCEDKDATNATQIAYAATNELFFAPKVAEATGYSIVLTGVSIMNGDNEIFAGDLTYDIPEATLFEQGKAYNFVVTIDAEKTELPTITFASTEAAWDKGGDVELN